MITSHWRVANPDLCHANNTCVEVGRAWRKSSHSGPVNCVEAGQQEQRVALRDTKDLDRGIITMSRSSFGKLLTQLKD